MKKKRHHLEKYCGFCDSLPVVTSVLQVGLCAHHNNLVIAIRERAEKPRPPARKPTTRRRRAEVSVG